MWITYNRVAMNANTYKGKKTSGSYFLFIASVPDLCKYIVMHYIFVNFLRISRHLSVIELV